MVPEGARVSYQLARIQREGTAAEKLLALQSYWDSSSISQVALALNRAARPPSESVGLDRPVQGTQPWPDADARWPSVQTIPHSREPKVFLFAFAR